MCINNTCISSNRKPNNRELPMLWNLVEKIMQCSTINIINNNQVVKCKGQCNMIQIHNTRKCNNSSNSSNNNRIKCIIITNNMFSSNSNNREVNYDSKL